VSAELVAGLPTKAKGAKGTPVCLAPLFKLESVAALVAPEAPGTGPEKAMARETQNPGARSVRRLPLRTRSPIVIIPHLVQKEA